MDRTVYLRMSEQDGEHWWFVARRRILADQVAQMDLDSDARLLEAGCGPGGNLRMLGRFGTLEAFELDDEARAIATKRSGIAVGPGALPDQVSYRERSFDLIAALDVLEHINDDKGSVKALAKLLRPGGRLLITVPAYMWMWSGHDERHHHFRRYSRSKIVALVQEAGLIVEKSSYFNALLFPLIVATRLIKMLIGAKNAPDDRIPSPLTNRILGAIFASERFWLRCGSFPFGVSIICVARQKGDR